MMSFLSFQKTSLALQTKQTASVAGMTMLETLPVLVIFLVLITYGLGFFGMIHTGILNSISARAYAFETLQNRADVRVFRDYDFSREYTTYEPIGNRVHAISSEKNADQRLGDSQFGTTRTLAFGRNIANSSASAQEHNFDIYNIVGRNRRGGVEVSPAWIMMSYGICINERCGDQ